MTKQIVLLNPLPADDMNMNSVLFSFARGATVTSLALKSLNCLEIHKNKVTIIHIFIATCFESKEKYAECNNNCKRESQIAKQ